MLNLSFKNANGILEAKKGRSLQDTTFVSSCTKIIIYDDENNMNKIKSVFKIYNYELEGAVFQ